MRLFFNGVSDVVQLPKMCFTIIYTAAALASIAFYCGGPHSCAKVFRDGFPGVFFLLFCALLDHRFVPRLYMRQLLQRGNGRVEKGQWGERGVKDKRQEAGNGPILSSPLIQM